MKNKIREFIENNSLSFEEGSRNFTMVVLIGFTQYLGLSKEDLEKELTEEIEADNVIQDEIDERWAYCMKNNYKKFWTYEVAKAQWVF